MPNEPLKLQVTALTARDGKLMIEMIYAEKPEFDYSHSIGVTLRLLIGHESQFLPEAELEALKRVRSLVGSEIQRIEKNRGQSD